MFVKNQVFEDTEGFLIPELKRFLKGLGLPEIACCAPNYIDLLIRYSLISEIYGKTILWTL